VGDGKSSGAAHQVDPDDLRFAAHNLRKLASTFSDDGVIAFKSGMKNYSMATLDKVTSARSKRIHGEDFSKAAADPKGIQHAGATSDWLNPFGRFSEADKLQFEFDNVHLSATKDGEFLVAELKQLANALDAAADFYQKNEGKNTDLSKKMMKNLLVTSPAGTRL
jgi:hypothetical protein